MNPSPGDLWLDGAFLGNPGSELFIFVTRVDRDELGYPPDRDHYNYTVHAIEQTSLMPVRIAAWWFYRPDFNFVASVNQNG